jgi:hypothetical protein
MSDSEPDYVPPSPNAESPASRILRRRSGELWEGLTGRETAARSSQSRPSQRVVCRLPTNARVIAGLKAGTNRRLHGQDYDDSLSLRVIRAALTLQQDWLREKRKKGKEGRGSGNAPKVRETVCRLFGVGAATYSKILAGYLNNQYVLARANEEIFPKVRIDKETDDQQSATTSTSWTSVASPVDKKSHTK